MAFEGSSFNLWTDVNLTVQFSGTFSVVHKTDLSDNPQDFLLYLGSPLDTRQLQASSNPGVDDITFTPVDILPEWEASTAYTQGQRVQPPGGNGYVYECTTAGTTGGSEPSWPTSGFGTTVVDNTVIWTLVAPHHGITEMKLALTSGGLGSATGGVPLAIANTVLGGVDEAVEIHIRITNTVQNVTNNTGNEELAIDINACIETAV